MTEQQHRTAWSEGLRQSARSFAGDAIQGERNPALADNVANRLRELIIVDHKMAAASGTTRSAKHVDDRTSSIERQPADPASDHGTGAVLDDPVALFGRRDIQHPPGRCRID